MLLGEMTEVENSSIIYEDNQGDVYIKSKETKEIIIINPKFLKALIFCDSNYATAKETRNSVSILVATLGGTLITRSSKTQRTVTLIITE